MKLSDLNLLDVGNAIQLVGAIYQLGDDDVYLAPFPGELEVEVVEGEYGPGDEPVPCETLEMDLADWQAFLRQLDVLDIEATVVGKHGKIGKGILRKSQRQISQRVSWAVYRRDGYRCRYCGNDETPLSVDHLVTWETGGPSTEENLVACCKKCNRARGSMPYAEWLKSRHYKRVSTGLPGFVMDLNAAVVTRLPDIPRQARRSR